MARYPNGVNFKFKRPQKPESDKAVFELLRAMRGHETKDIWQRTFLARSTIANIRSRRTRYPMHLTCVAIASAIGMRYELVSEDDRPMQETRRRADQPEAHP